MWPELLGEICLTSWHNVVKKDVFGRFQLLRGDLAESGFWEALFDNSVIDIDAASYASFVLSFLAAAGVKKGLTLGHTPSVQQPMFIL